MAKNVIWRGSEAQAFELLQALNRHCACVTTARGALQSMCAPHRMLVDDERALNGLLFGRHIAARLRAEEFGSDPAPGPAQRHFNTV